MEYYIHSDRIEKRRQFSIVRLLAGIFILLFLFIAVKTVIAIFAKESDILSPITSPLGQIASGQKNNSTKGASMQSLSSLQSEIGDILAKQRGSWSVYFVDFTQDQRFGINEQVIYRAASVNKLYVLASLYYLAGKNKIDLDETITLQSRDIQDFGTGIIRYDPPGTVYSLKTLARLLAEKSDNTAEFILRAKMGDGQIQLLVEQFGMKQTSIVENKTSLSDIALLFEKMENGEITNKAYTSEMIDFLDQSDFEDRLPALLPKDVHVYHKIGNEVGNIHDVGLFVKGDVVYFLGVFSSDIGDTEEEAKKTIAQISKIVFDFKNNGG